MSDLYVFESINFLKINNFNNFWKLFILIYIILMYIIIILIYLLYYSDGLINETSIVEIKCPYSVMGYSNIVDAILDKKVIFSILILS